jgi:AP-3 complex subunit beta
VLAVVRVFYYAGPCSQVSKTLNPLLRLLHVSREVERVVLEYLLELSRSFPVGVAFLRSRHNKCTNSQNLLAPFYTRVLIHSDDLRQTKQGKIQLLLNIITSDNHQAILREFIVGLIYWSRVASL